MTHSFMQLVRLWLTSSEDVIAEVTLTPEQYRRLVRLITERADIRTEIERDILLKDADLEEFIARLHPGTQAKVFSSELVSELQRYGTLKRTGQPALVALLRVLRDNLEGHEDEVEFINGLLTPYEPTAHGTQSVTLPVSVVRILFLAANPRNTPVLRLSEEIRTIEERLKQTPLRDHFQLIQHHAVRWSDLAKYLLDQRPHIVHFSGHGSEGSEIALEDDSGNVQIITATALSDLFRILKDDIRVVVLNACWSENQARAITQYIDCAIGMTRPIDDRAAISFAAGFYQGLGYGRSIQTAFDLGKSEFAPQIPSNTDVPELLPRAGVDPAQIVLIQPNARSLIS